jgi:hypothetical protein
MKRLTAENAEEYNHWVTRHDLASGLKPKAGAGPGSLDVLQIRRTRRLRVFLRKLKTSAPSRGASWVQVPQHGARFVAPRLPTEIPVLDNR